ncbi:hypothetical protein, partial [Martelella sp. UBA3392]|uniref:hypothetical protein n=1 Tax=Martelella sp. UBA3392 TaxID=1946834 RepID=UPI0031F52307
SNPFARSNFPKKIKFLWILDAEDQRRDPISCPICPTRDWHVPPDTIPAAGSPVLAMDAFARLRPCKFSFPTSPA